MDTLISFLIKRPIAVIVSVFALCILGTISLMQMPKTLLPDIDIPRISIVMDAENLLNNSNVHENLIQPLSNKLIKANGFKSLEAQVNSRKIKFEIEFDYSTNMELAYFEINDLVDIYYEEGNFTFDRPTIFLHNISDLPILFINVFQEPPVADHYTFDHLSDFIYNKVKRQLEQIPEVSFVDITGGEFKQIVISPYTERLQSLNANAKIIWEAINHRNLNLNSTKVRDGNYYFTLQIREEIPSIDSYRKIPIVIGGRTFRLDQLATVQFQQESKKGTAMFNQEPAISMALLLNGSSTAIGLKLQVIKIISELKKQYPQLRFEIIRDQSQVIDASINNLLVSLLLGLFFAGLIVFILQSKWVHSIIIITCIPISLIISFLAFNLLDLTINIITLSGLVICVGLMIDNAIIVLDNVIGQSNVEDGIHKITIKGTTEVIQPLFSSFLTTCGLFLPLVFLSGISGVLFFEQAIAITISLFISLLLSITFLPAIFVFLSKRNFSKPKNFLFHIYENILIKCLDKPKIVITIFLVVLAVSIWQFRTLKSENFPAIKENYMVINLEWDYNYEQSVIIESIKSIHTRFKDQLSAFSVIIGPSDFIIDETKDQSNRQAQVVLQQKEGLSAIKLKKEIHTHLVSNLPNTTFQFSQIKTPFNSVFGEANELDTEILVKNGRFGSLNKPDTIVQNIINVLPEVLLQKPESSDVIYVNYHDQELKRYKISLASLEFKLKELTSARRSSIIKENDNNSSVNFGNQMHDLYSIISRSFILNQDSVLIPIRSLISVEKESQPLNRFFDHHGEYLPIRLKQGEVTLVQEKLSKELKNGDIEVRGKYFDRLDFIEELSIVFLVSVLLLYFILSIQFESLIQPMIVLLEIPIGLLGSFVFLKLMGMTINIMSGIGVIFLIGIMINDSILKVDKINRLVKYSSLRNAILEAGKSRFNAIVATSATSILSISPLLIFDDLGSDLQTPLATVLIGGLLTSTIASLFFIPTIYLVVHNNHRFIPTKPPRPAG